MLERYMLSSCVPVSVRLSVRSSATSRYYIETTGRIELVFGTYAFFHLYPTLHYKEIWVSPKIRKLSSETLSQTLDIEKFATQVDGIVDKTCRRRACGLRRTRRTVCHRMHIVYYASVDCNPVTLYFDLFWICCTTCSYNCAAVKQISTVAFAAAHLLVLSLTVAVKRRRPCICDSPDVASYLFTLR